jgi:hypothetical protein
LSLTLENAHDLMNPAKLKLYYIDSKLIYVIQTPLAINIDFSVFHLIPIPVPHKDTESTYLFIQPQVNYITITIFGIERSRYL